jgi:DNA modification methylase
MSARIDSIETERPRRGNNTEASLAEKFAAQKRAWARRPAILNTKHSIYVGDARKMQQLKDQPVHLVLTSPPYWNLKRYAGAGNGSQLGHIADREQFLAELEKVWTLCFQRLIPGGRLCIVVGDVCRSRKVHGRHFVEPLHAHLQALCQRIGFDPLAPIIWNKIANVTTEVAGNGSTFLGKPYEPGAVIKNDIEFVLLFRKPGEYRHPTQEQRDLSMISREDHRRWFQQVWNDVPGENQRQHPAPFPIEVARRLIGMFSFVGDTVLDPFWGIGNTTLAAMEMHRSSIGFEIEPAYVEIGQKRLATKTNSSIKVVRNPPREP